ncbi:MAG: MerR family transcriptional regulator [Desulfobacteraceae bacterium]|nr:MerR family transcriptional regulator [Desulfobacteraceae bacterium]
MTKRFEKTYSIGGASRITGVSQRQLRAWEGKHIPQPDRLICGERAYRRYNQTQINLIARIKKYQDQGFTLKTAAKKAAEDMARKGGTG